MNHFEGIKLGMTFDQYHLSSGVNHSSAEEMDISPQHYLQKITAPPEEPTDAQTIGKITHSAILENDFSGFVVKPQGMSFVSKEGKAWRDAQTKQIITQEIAGNIAGMMTAVKNHPMASRILYAQEGNNEVSCWAKHPESGLLIKGRSDRVTVDNQQKTTVVDLKTCGRGEGASKLFQKSLTKWHYASQAAFYFDLFGASFFVFVVVEKEPPFAVSCFNLSAEALAYGRKKYNAWLAKILDCATSGKWPAYAEELSTISIPDWELKREM